METPCYGVESHLKSLMKKSNFKTVIFSIFLDYEWTYMYFIQNILNDD